jgi:hypothetical protein
MAIDIKSKVAEKVIKTHGYDMPIVGEGQTVRAACSDYMGNMDNKDIQHDAVIEVSFLKPTPFTSMRGKTLQHTELSRELIIGGQIDDNGFIVVYEANVK